VRVRTAARGGGLAAGLAASLLGAVFGVTKPTSRMEQETQVYSVRVPPDVRPGSVFVIEHFGLQYQVQAPVPPSVDGTVQVRLPTAPVAQQQTQQAAQQQAQQRQAQQQQQQQQQQQPPGGQPGAAAGGEEWTMWQDSASGRHFYRNARTGQTMWAP